MDDARTFSWEAERATNAKWGAHDLAHVLHFSILCGGCSGDLRRLYVSLIVLRVHDAAMTDTHASWWWAGRDGLLLVLAGE